MILPCVEAYSMARCSSIQLIFRNTISQESPECRLTLELEDELIRFWWSKVKNQRFDHSCERDSSGMS